MTFKQYADRGRESSGLGITAKSEKRIPAKARAKIENPLYDAKRWHRGKVVSNFWETRQRTLGGVVDERKSNRFHCSRPQ